MHISYLENVFIVNYRKTITAKCLGIGNETFSILANRSCRCQISLYSSSILSFVEDRRRKQKKCVQTAEKCWHIHQSDRGTKLIFQSFCVIKHAVVNQSPKSRLFFTVQQRYKSDDPDCTLIGHDKLLLLSGLYYVICSSPMLSG